MSSVVNCLSSTTEDKQATGEGPLRKRLAMKLVREINAKLFVIFQSWLMQTLLELLNQKIVF